MKSRIVLILVLVVGMYFPIFGQSCGTSGTTLQLLTQAQVDDFTANFPGCSNYLGSIYVGNFFTGQSSNITNLMGLSSLNSIQGDLYITYNPNLNSLNDLDITTLNGELKILNNSNLSDLSGFSNLISMNGVIELENNPSILNLTDLSNLTSVGGLYIGSMHGLTNLNGLGSLHNFTGPIWEGLKIWDNNNLTSLQGISPNISLDGQVLSVQWNEQITDISQLINLTSLYHLEINSNANLPSLDGLDNVSSVTYRLSINSNNLLTNLDELSSLSGSINILIINNNNNLDDIYGIENISISQLVHINNNPFLSECEVESVCDYVSIPFSSTFISNNANGCATRAQVEAACLALPVTWTHPLQIYQENQSHILTWSVESQVNNDYFEIQHSIDGQDFYPIGRVDGEGSYTREKEYDFRHEKPSIGQNYYRIRQVDYDGSYDYSNIVFIQTKNVNIEVFPNPTTDKIMVQASVSGNIAIINGIGQVFGYFEIAEGLNTIEITTLQPGFYFIKDSNNNLLKMVKM